MFAQLSNIFKTVTFRKTRRGTTGEVEEATIVKDFDGRRVIIERANGELWILQAKASCDWSWKYEGRKVLLQLGHASSKLTTGGGEVSEFWTGNQSD